jgi:putative ABC transport system permease protein
VTGLIVTVVSALLPARRAGRVPPLAAMRDAAFEFSSVSASRKRTFSGLVVMAAGVAIVVAVTAGASNGFLGLGILGVFIGTIVLGPVIAKPVAHWLGVPVRKVRGVTGQMAQENSTRNPKRTSRTAAPVLIGVALVTAVSALATSITGQIDSVFTKQFKGDYTISTQNRGDGGLSPTLEDDIAKLPEVQGATGLGLVAAKVGTSTGNTGQFITYISPSSITGIYELGMVQGDVSKLTPDGVLVSQKNAKNNGYSVGSTIPMTFADGAQRTLTVQGIYANNQLVRKFVVSRQMLESTTVRMFDFGIYIKVKPGQNSTKTRAALQAAVDKYGQGKLLNKKEFIKQASGNVQQLLGLIYGLLMLSIIIAIVGIVITLLLSVFERQREIGLLRAVGMTKGQVRTTVRWESVITSLIGAVMGIVLGVGLGWVIVFALRDKGLSTFHLPIGSTIFILIVSFVVGVLAAVYPAWRATKVDILAALVTN